MLVLKARHESMNDKKYYALQCHPKSPPNSFGELSGCGDGNLQDIIMSLI